MAETFRITIPADFGSGTVNGVFEAFTNPVDDLQREAEQKFNEVENRLSKLERAFRG